GVCRSSGSRVRLPTRTTRLMLAMLLFLLFFLRTNVRASVLGLPADRLDRLDRLGARTAGAVSSLDATRGEMAHDAVGDLQDPRQLVERLRLGVELEQVVDPVRRLVDLVRELAPPPGIVFDPGTAGVLDQ